MVPAAGFRMGYGSRQLRRHGDEKGHLVLGKLAALPLPHHQYAQYATMMNDGNTQKAVVILLTGFGNELVAGMIRGVIEIEGLRRFRHHAHHTVPHGK
jgi:hypothetical protein